MSPFTAVFGVSGWHCYLLELRKTKSKMKVLECSQHYTLIFQTLKGKKSTQSVVEIQTHTSFLCMSSLPERIKKLECSQYVSNYNSMELFPGAQWQLIPQSVVGAGRSLNSSEI